MITAPLVMPDVITGLSLLLLFVALRSCYRLALPIAGMLTIWFGARHFLYRLRGSGEIASRLRELDRSIEEAAMDLGAAPLKVFFVITLPMIMPAVISGWLLAFTLSLDDLVIASFVSGPGATTLPMLVFSSVRMGVNPEIKRAGDVNPRRGRNRRIYCLVPDGASGKTADSRYPACKTRLKPLKSSTMAMRCRAGRGIIFREDIHWDL
ncbi:putrescine ABC transporter membrane protein [Salmonella enterica subsp. enterica]|nr:putrescine ABC transporter membrane protein [Salmonella enterica subsp. enterica]